ncbi:MAG TPA: NAD-dependent epimerase/dehydratase family protein [Phycisphaeraceae bacterium]
MPAQSSPELPLAPTALIVGCGYLGRHVAQRLLAMGGVVYGTTRSTQRAQQLARIGVRPMLVQVTQPLTLAALRPAMEAESLDVYHLVPPGRPGQSPSPRQVVLGGTAHLVKTLRHARVRRAVMTSSTAVYSQRDGARVDADTPAQPLDERGKLLLEGERLWLQAGASYYVVRLAGLYGPGRIIGQQALQQGAPLVGDPQAMLNLIHVEDAADLLLAVMRSAGAGRVELGCDGRPVPRIDYYTHLAQRLGLNPPAVLDDVQAAVSLGLNLQRLRSASSKTLDPTITCQRTGWRPRYRDYRQGLDALLPRPA